MTDSTRLAELKIRLQDIAYLRSAVSVLSWDQEVYMPKRGVGARAATISQLSGIVHEKIIALDADKLLTQLRNDLAAGKLSDQEQLIVREVSRDYDRATKLPLAFVKKLALVTSEAGNIWAEAREKSDFALFLPALKEIIALKQQEAEYLGYTDSPYDALIDEFEPYMTSQQIAEVFSELKNFLVPFLHKIKTAKTKPDPSILRGKYPINEQVPFNRYVAAKMGFDFDAGRIDTSTHPFATGFHPYDVRITTRYKESDLFYSLMSVTHEVGHALYEQGVLAEHFGTPLSEAISFGIHESQSRMWENMLGRSRSFWKYFYPKLKKTFPEPFNNIALGDFYRAINTVKPSLIRTEADEVTYSLHIIVRFEIEKGLIEGTLKAEDLPQIWNAKMKEYLGVTVPNDAKGVLQDVHWSFGGFGYFPSYALGNLYASQFFAAMRKDLDVDTLLDNGELLPIRDWLREHIHIHGRTYTAAQIIEKVSGEPLNARHFIDYLTERYTDIYKL